jgi:hypothetical protein
MLAPLPLLLPRIRPTSAVWVNVLLGLGCAALAVSFYWLWQWLDQPLLAYLDVLVYGLYALLAAFCGGSRRHLPADEPTTPASGAP